MDVVGISEDSAGFYLQASLIGFLISRFVMTYLLGSTKLLLAMGVLGVVLSLIAVTVQNETGLIAVVCISLSLSLSLMFRTIYGVALQGLGEDTKFGAAGLVMAILGEDPPPSRGGQSDARQRRAAPGDPGARGGRSIRILARGARDAGE